MAKLNFLDISQPPVYVAANYIAKILSDSPSSDYSSSLFLLPTHSAIRLVKFLALEKLSKLGINSIMGFRIMTPEMFFSNIRQGAKLANPFQSAEAWYKALDENKNLPNLFKARNPEKSDYLQLVEEFSSLGSELAQCGKTLFDASKIFSQFGDKERWDDIAKLEKSYLSNLSLLGCDTLENIQIKSINLEMWNSAFPNLKNIYLIGLPDAPMILIEALKKIEKRGVSIISAIFSDDRIRDNQKRYFDEFGIPSKAWLEENMPIEDSNIFVVDSIESQANLCAKAVKKYGVKDAAKAVCIVCSQSDSAPVLIDRLGEKSNAEDVSIPAYSPEGISLARLGVGRFFISLLKVLRDSKFSTYLDILKNSFVLDKLVISTGETAEDIILSAEKFALQYMPKNLKTALKIKVDTNVYAHKDFILAKKVFQSLSNLIFPDELNSPNQQFKYICNSVFFNSSAKLWSFEGERDLVLKFLSDQIDQMETSNSRFLELADLIEIVLRNASILHFAEKHSEGSIPLIDWLEAFWAPQQHVFIADFNSGILPSKPRQNAFIPDSKRTFVGLRAADARLARDAYMFYVMLKSRRINGRVSCIVPRLRSNGDAASASELLLKCSEQNLPLRVEKLFVAPQGNSNSIAPDKTRKFTLPRADIKKKILSPSAIKAYLKCPFRFYLHYVLGMNVNDYTRDELDAMEVGTFMHKIWERFSCSVLRDSADPAEIEKFLSREFDNLRLEFFGKDISGALEIQLASLKKSLPIYAAIQADRRRLGWKIKEAGEKKIDNYKIGDFEIHMRIDRIDEDQCGNVCLIDYKTFDRLMARKGLTEAESRHIKNKRDSDNKLVASWSDLQLPLYVDAYKKLFNPTGKVTSAYFIMSKNAQDSKIEEWDIEEREMNGENMLTNAINKAQNVVDAISRREFIPTENIPERQDEFAKIFSFAEGDIPSFMDLAEREK